jgi:predicted Fe-Mo cluster-binding NifX family protein
LCAHFGHCSAFAVVETDASNTKVVSRHDVEAPPHEPGLLPRWLGNLGVHVVLAGGMGMKAQQLFTSQGIQVHVGCPGDTPEQLVQNYLAGNLQTGSNLCDH